MNKPAPVSPQVHELIRERWSPRAFADRPVDSDALRSLLEAAQWAPSCFNEQPWTFIVATREVPEEHERLLGCLVAGNQVWAKHAPVLMVSVARLAFDRNGKPNRHAFHDVGLAAAQLTLQATSLGLAVHQMGGIEIDKIRQTYRVPEGCEPVAGFAVGYPGDPESLPEKIRTMELAPRKRKPLSAIAFAGRWGESASFADD